MITSDAGLERDLTDALLRAGVPDRNQVFGEHISPQIARIGRGSEADDFMTLMRYAEPNDKAAGDKWRQQLPLVVLRVRDTNIARPAEPVSAPTREERVARSELGLANDVDKLAQTIKERWGQPGAAEGKFQSLLLMIDLLGEHCLQRTRDCLGDNSDADYQISPTEGLDGGQVLAVAGDARHDDRQCHLCQLVGELDTTSAGRPQRLGQAAARDRRPLRHRQRR